MILKLENIEIDDDIYPREIVDWRTVYKYQEAMAAGAQFPRLVVGRRGGGFVLIDGRMRYQAYKQNKVLTCQVHVTKAVPHAFYAEAVKLNCRHGRPLSIQERVRAIVQLQGLGYSEAHISRIVSIPVEKLGELVSQRTLDRTDAEGMTVLRAPIHSLARGLLRRANLEEEQRVFAAPDQMQIFSQALMLVERGWIEKDEGVIGVVDRLYEALRQWKKRAA